MKFRYAAIAMAVSVMLSSAAFNASSMHATEIDTITITGENFTQQEVLPAPEITALSVSVEGVQLSWNAVEGAEGYCVLRKTDKTDWRSIGTAQGGFYTDKTVSSGEKYFYTVCCLDENGNTVSSYNEGREIEYIRIPLITKFNNTATGAKITWTKCEGAAKYRIFYLDKNGSWKKLADTSAVSYTHEKLTSGTKYTYTVRCLDSKGGFISGYDKNGFSNVFLTAPKLKTVTSVNGGVKVTWSKLKGATDYRVLRKAEGEKKWTEIGTSKSGSFVDKKVNSGKKYTYTVRCIDAGGKNVSVYGSGKSVKYVKAPVITKFNNTATGTKITWKKCSGAAKYRVYYINSNGKLKKLTDTSAVSYTHEKLTSGTKYTYTVRCLDSKGGFISGYDKNGFSNVFLTAPKLTAVTNVNGGVKVTWKKLKGAAGYRVLRKAENEKKWTEIGTSKSGSFIDKKVNSGKKYTYTVRCIDANGKNVSVYGSGKALKYVKAPVISKFNNTATGTKITWKKCAGAAKYRVFYLDKNGSWKKLADTASLSYTHNKLVSGKTYKYKVRCLDKNGKFVSGAGNEKSNVFILPPEITSVSKTDKGTLLGWSAVKGAAGYCVYRKELGGEWKEIARVASLNEYTDTSASEAQVYSYSLRCTDKNGNFISDYLKDTRYYADSKPANGEYKIGKETYRFNNGFFRSGLQTVDGKKYYYDSKGNLQKNGIVGSEADGWYYANKKGVINFNYVNGITQNGVNWIVSNGKAVKAKTKAEMVLFRAAKEVYKATDTTMTKQQKLKACFDYSKTAYKERNPRIPHYTGMDWHIIYANDMFIDGAGNCFSYGAAFAYMAKAIGYTEVYCCSSGGHGWAEIDGKVYDPEWSKHNFNYTYFGLDYNKVKNPNYKGAIAAGYPWMRIKI